LISLDKMSLSEGWSISYQLFLYNTCSISLALKVITLTKDHLFRIHSFTYVSANQWGTLKHSAMSLKVLSLNIGRGCNLFTQKCQNHFKYAVTLTLFNSHCSCFGS
jgi:hypothetical protein